MTDPPHDCITHECNHRQIYECRDALAEFSSGLIDERKRLRELWGRLHSAASDLA